MENEDDVLQAGTAAENPVDEGQKEPDQDQKKTGDAQGKSLSDAIMDKLDEIEQAAPENDDQTAPKQNEGDQSGEPEAGKTPAHEGKAGEKKTDGKKAEDSKTPEEEEAELINTAKTDRGKERLQKIFAERREGKLAQQNLNQLVENFQSAGFDDESLNTVLAIGRLVSSGDKEQIRKGIEAIDKIRANLCSELGEDVAARDPLDDYPDIKRSVDEMGMDRKQAYEIMRARLAQQEEARRQQQQQQAALLEQQIQQKIKDAQVQVQQFFYSKKDEVDFGRKIKAIQSHLNPERLQQFTRVVPPEQWAAQIELMWNSLSVGKEQPEDRPRPISSRSVNRGSAGFDPKRPLSDSIMDFMDANGM